MTAEIKIKHDSSEYSLKRSLDLSIKSIGDGPQLCEPTDEQKEWVLFRLSHAETWPQIHENKIGNCKKWT
jgi:hypothetical protein